ncbi:host cell division inhibitor Icd-like protein [Escherichia coli]|uniref:host cell division inhibitor Icd-like protein n=1 Tax=Escherichia coli TaxID=562 RepID=UPI001D7C5681|nr:MULTISPECIES: host cell division inhibitor Icd-like protein [Enterobacterales]EFN6654560.1 host cell division inhibitor Icd-like protein [Escherichia coli O166:H6]EFN6737880.1 host cell division inhibitor Icd-like protein [Escherichia coli H6]MDE8641940.1 host cell division inhibitor Icd-like protein [Proteus mirabilis]
MIKNITTHGRVNELYLSPKKRLHWRVFLSYADKALAKSSVRIETLNIQTATHDAPCVFFCVRARAHLQNTVLCRPDSMVALVGQPSGWLVSVCASSLNPVNVTTPIEIETSGGDSDLLQTEIAIMAAITTSSRIQFIWRFFSCQQSKYFIVKATSEQEARSMLPDSPCLFSARIRQEVQHG